jgi:hypothetical protein
LLGLGWAGHSATKVALLYKARVNYPETKEKKSHHKFRLYITTLMYSKSAVWNYDFSDMNTQF